MDSAQNSTTREIRRVPIACIICRQRKLRCRKINEESKSCQRCIADGNECIYIPVNAASDDAYYPAQAHGRLASFTGSPPPAHHYSGSDSAQSNRTHPHPQQTTYWPGQSGGLGLGVADAQHTRNDYSRPEMESYPQYSQYAPYPQQATSFPQHPSAQYAPYASTSAWPMQPAYYNEAPQSTNASVVVGHGPSPENYSSPYMAQYTQDQPRYPSDWAGSGNEYQSYEGSNDVYDGQRVVDDAAGNYYPDHYGNQSENTFKPKE